MSFPERILVLDGETNHALACIRSLGRAGYKVMVASHWRRALASWSRYCEVSFHLAGHTVEAYASMRRWAVSRGVKVVLPTTERSCILCNIERQEWEAEGIILGCEPQEVLIQAFDKERTLKLASVCGLRIPPTHRPTSLEDYHRAAIELGFPCVIKPRFSNAWNGDGFLPDKGCAYVYSSDELDSTVLALKQGDFWPLIQGYVPGQGKGVFALCDRGEVVAWFAHERLRDVRPTGSGSSLRRSVALELRLREPAELLLSKMQWHGPAMVEFRDDNAGAPCLMEVNGRFWTSLQLGIAAGVDFPNLWLTILTGKGVSPVSHYREGITLRWLWGDVKRFFYIAAGPPSGYKGPYPTLWQGIKDLLGAQPSGTQLESWQADDPWPAVGEWVQGVQEILTKGKARLWHAY